EFGDIPRCRAFGQVENLPPFEIEGVYELLRQLCFADTTPSADYETTPPTLDLAGAFPTSAGGP
ncbi:hypothetical protein ACC709_36165, partial [Rhizobium ruizarguesonis]